MMNWILATVCYDSLKPGYVESLAETLSGPFAPPKGHYKLVNYIYLTFARPFLIEMVKSEFIGEDLDGVLWIDSDMAWSQSDLGYILAQTERLPGKILGGFYMTRKSPLKVVGRPLAFCDDPDVNDPIFSNELIRADYLGLGFTWTPWSCFDEDRKPWFGEDGMGEDVFFCRRQREKFKVPIYGLTALDVGHAYEPGVRRISDLRKR